MGHFAKVINGLVVDVNVATEEWVEAQPDIWYVKWVQTSYNLYGGVYYDNATSQPVENQAEAIAAQDGRQRKNYAGIGYTYDPDRDAFIPPKPYPSWILNEDTCLWDPPIPYPEDGMHTWNEETQSWDPVEADA
jgi:hypothetical protein